MNNETSQDWLPWLIGLSVLGLVSTVFWWFNKRSKTILESWADTNGFQILEWQRRYMIFTGPFKFWTNSRNQTVYNFKVRDCEGLEKSGWARCGSFWGGVFFSDKIEVIWD